MKHLIAFAALFFISCVHVQRTVPGAYDYGRSEESRVTFKFESDSAYRAFIHDLNNTLIKYNNSLITSEDLDGDRCVEVPIHIYTEFSDSGRKNPKTDITEKSDEKILPKITVADIVLDACLELRGNKIILFFLTEDSLAQYVIKNGKVKTGWSHKFNKFHKREARDVLGKMFIIDSGLNVINSSFKDVCRFNRETGGLISESMSTLSLFNNKLLDNVKVKYNYFTTDNFGKICFYDFCSGDNFFCFIDINDRIRIYNPEGKQIYVSQEKFGSQAAAVDSLIAVSAPVADRDDYIRVFERGDRLKEIYRTQVFDGSITSLRLIKNDNDIHLIYVLVKNGMSEIGSIKINGDN
ncbi:MAG: hypothetical protein ABIA63_14485 [bacterium]